MIILLKVLGFDQNAIGMNTVKSPQVFMNLKKKYGNQSKIRKPIFDGKEIYNPAGIYLLKVNNRNTRTRCEICSKLTINTPERRHWRPSGVFIVNFEHISHLVLVFLLLTLNK